MSDTTAKAPGPATLSAGAALLRMAREVHQYRDVLWQLVRQFLTLRYRRTALGYVWTLVNPLMMMSVTAVVFATLFKLDLATYAVFLFAGMVPWNFFSMTVTQSCTSFIHNEGLIKKIYLPKIVFPLSLAIGMAVDSFLALMALFLLVVLFGAPLTSALLFVPVAYALLFTFTFGVALIASVATVFFRDLQYVISVVMQAWFFLTPVMYRHDALAGKVAAVVALNPMVAFIELFRAPLYLGQWPSLQAVGVAAAVAVCALALGVLILLRQEKHIVFRL
jgi:ABC-2 type transport system permease protein/lipopolysaccharide transport system permease protein